MTEMLEKTQIISLYRSVEIVFQSCVGMHSFLQKNKANLKSFGN